MDEKNHINVTEVRETGINRKVVVVMEEENHMLSFLLSTVS